MLASYHFARNSYLLVIVLFVFSNETCSIKLLVPSKAVGIGQMLDALDVRCIMCVVGHVTL